MINVWLAVEASNFRKFRDNFTDNPTRNDFSKRMRKFLQHHTIGDWLSPTINGVNYHVLNIEVTPQTVTIGRKLRDLKRIREILPGKEIIIGAWNRDGSQYGDPPVYPIHPNMLEFMPADADGCPATTFKQVNKLQGRPDRTV